MLGFIIIQLIVQVNNFFVLVIYINFPYFFFYIFLYSIFCCC
jgi:hypothetical protein